MKFTGRFLVGLVLLQGVAYAQTPQPTPQAAPQPEIQVVDGKVSMAVQSMPLSRVLSLLDRAMGMTSTVKPELANRNISVRFTNLELKDAVHKIFEGQPFNYMLVQGKGIRVIDLAQGGSTTSTASSSSSFQDSPISQPPPTVTPLQPVQPNTQPITAQPVTAQPVNPAAQAQPPATPFGGAPASAPSTNPAATPATPGQLPPPVGGANPLTTPAGAPQVPVGGFPVTPPPAPQPTGPGTLGGAAPGTVPTR